MIYIGGFVMEENKIALLKETLEVYKEKWEWEREKLPKYVENIRMHVKKFNFYEKIFLYCR